MRPSTDITDIIPKNTILISGSVAFKGDIRPDEAVYITYRPSADQTWKLEFQSTQISFWKKDYQLSYKFKQTPNAAIINFLTAVQGTAATINPNTTLEPVFPVPTETPVLAEVSVPKGLFDIINEVTPWLEGVISMVMLSVTIILMLILHVFNR